MGSGIGTTAPSAKVRVWDLPTRLFHWLLVLTIISAWFSTQYAEQLDDPTLKWHRYNGYVLLILVAFRLLWGVVGGSTSRWAFFVRSPGMALRYGLDLVGGKERKFLGHNPLGTYMVLALLVAVSVQATLGLLVTEHNETTWGPLFFLVPESLQGRVRHWHVSGLYWVVLPLACLHILANVLYGVLKRDPLVRAMVTGEKPAAAYEDAREAVAPSNGSVRALGMLLLAIAIVLGGIKLLGGKLIY